MRLNSVRAWWLLALLTALLLAAQWGLGQALTGVKGFTTDRKGRLPAVDISGELLDESMITRSVNRTMVDVTALGDTELVPAQGAGNKIRVLGLYIRSGAAVSVKLKTAGNNLSASFALGVNDDLVLPENKHGWFQTNANEALNINSSLAVASGVQVVWIVVQ